jgi:hypothetical protein
MISASQEVVELEAEPGARGAVRPHLGVLAVAAVGRLRPLSVQMVGDRRMEPGERVLAVAHDEEPVDVGIVRAIGIVTDLGQPVACGPPAGVTEDELVENARRPHATPA